MIEREISEEGKDANQLEKLIGEIKTNCALLCIDREHFLPQGDPVFGVSNDEHTQAFGIISPSRIFASRFDKFRLPRVLRTQAEKNDQEYQKLVRNSTYVIQYPLEEKRLRASIASVRKVDDDLIRYSQGKYQPTGNNVQDIAWWKTKFGNDIACIWTSLMESTIIIGNTSNTQKVMDFLKATPSNYEQFYRTLCPGIQELIDADLNWPHFKKGIHIYDMIKSPKELRSDSLISTDWN